MHFLGGHITVKCKPIIVLLFFTILILFSVIMVLFDCTITVGLICLVLKYIYIYFILRCYPYFELSDFFVFKLLIFNVLISELIYDGRHKYLKSLFII